jgi:hypothetical protein
LFSAGKAEKGVTMEQGEYTGWLKEILSIHFDPKKGSSYWLERARQLGIDPARDVHTLQDLKLLGPMDEESMKERPIEDFVPKCYRAEKARWVIGETGGTTGRPITTVYLDDEFYQAFVHPFERVALPGLPREKTGSGSAKRPHIIGKAAIACGERWDLPIRFQSISIPLGKRLAPESIGFKRYLDHVIEQAMQIIVTQDIKVLFTTPRVLKRLKDTMSRRIEKPFRGFILAGWNWKRIFSRPSLRPSPWLSSSQDMEIPFLVCVRSLRGTLLPPSIITPWDAV